MLRQLQVGKETVVLVDGAMGFNGLTELGQRTDVRLVTAGPVAPGGTGLVVDPTQPTFAGPPVQPVDPTHVTEEILLDVEGLFDLAEAPANAEPADEPYASFENALTPGTPQPDDGIILGLLGEPSIAVGQRSTRDLLEAVAPTAGTKSRRSSNFSFTWLPTAAAPPEGNGSPMSLPTRRSVTATCATW